MLQMYLVFLNVESIRGFTSTFVDICSAASYPFRFLYKIKWRTIGIIKFLVTTLMDQDIKVSFVLFDEYGALAIYSEFMRMCHNMKIIVQTTVEDASSLNGKSERTNKTLANTTRAILLKSHHKKELLCLDYQHYICLYRLTENRLCGDAN